MTISQFEPERFRSPEYLAVIDNTATSEQLFINTSCLNTLKNEAENGFPFEVCGLLIGVLNSEGWQVNSIRPVANLNTDRATDRFQLDPASYQAIERESRASKNDIIGVYHSHPDCPAKPSPTDLDNAWEGFAYPIISVCNGQVANLRCWVVNSSGDSFLAVNIEETT